MWPTLFHGVALKQALSSLSNDGDIAIELILLILLMLIFLAFKSC